MFNGTLWVSITPNEPVKLTRLTTIAISFYAEEYDPWDDCMLSVLQHIVFVAYDKALVQYEAAIVEGYSFTFAAPMNGELDKPFSKYTMEYEIAILSGNRYVTYAF
jgi:hypothetical protein